MYIYLSSLCWCEEEKENIECRVSVCEKSALLEHHRHHQRVEEFAEKETLREM